MRNKVLRVICLAGCLVLLLLLAGCKVEMDTDLRITQDFAGERVMQSDEKGDADFTGTSAEEVLSAIKKHCPEQLEVKMTEEQNGKSRFVFTLSFTSLDEYKQKVSALLGRQAAVEYRYEQGVFANGYSLTEDFTSGDLLKWVDSAVKTEISDRASFDVTYGSTVVTMNGVSVKSGLLSMGRVSVDTIRDENLMQEIVIYTGKYGDDDYSRDIEFRIPESSYNSIGTDKIEEFYMSVTPEGIEGLEKRPEETGEKYVSYLISVSGTLADVSSATGRVFGGSTMVYNDLSEEQKPFSESGVLSERYDFSGYACNTDGSAKVTLIYTARDGTTFREDGTTVMAGESPLKGEGLSDNGKSLTLIYPSTKSAEIKLVSQTSYMLDAVTVAANLPAAGEASVDVLVDYPKTSGNSGTEIAREYYEKKLSGIENAEVAAEEFAGSYRLRFSFTGGAEAACKAMDEAFGTGNQIIIKSKDGFSLFNSSNVVHCVNITGLLEDAGYTGLVSYSYRGSGTSAANVRWTNTSDGSVYNDMLGGKRRSNVFTVQASGGLFMMEYQYRQFNLVFLIVFIAAAALLVAVGSIIITILGRRGKARRQALSEKKRNEAIERSMALAVIQNPDGTIVELPKESMQNRPGAVVESKRDDGLDDDDDEPENVWLFSSTLKLISIIAIALCFFPFVTVSCTSGTTSSSSLSALQLLLGSSKYDYDIQGDPMMAILFVIPLLIVALLAVKKRLPKVLTAIAVGGMSLVNLWFLLNLEDHLKENLDALKAYATTGEITYQMAWAYQYSIVIYILLLIGAVVLAVCELSEKIRKKLH